VLTQLVKLRKLSSPDVAKIKFMQKYDAQNKKKTYDTQALFLLFIRIFYINKLLVNRFNNLPGILRNNHFFRIFVFDSNCKKCHLMTVCMIVKTVPSLSAYCVIRLLSHSALFYSARWEIGIKQD
jgi:hypothetical protein